MTPNLWIVDASEIVELPNGYNWLSTVEIITP